MTTTLRCRCLFGCVASSDGFDPLRYLDRGRRLSLMALRLAASEPAYLQVGGSLGDIGRVRELASARATREPRAQACLPPQTKLFASNLGHPMHGGLLDAPVAKTKDWRANRRGFLVLASLTRSGPPVAKDGGDSQRQRGRRTTTPKLKPVSASIR